jgi:hypothetical protein
VKIRCFTNQKPWIHTEVGAKLKDRATSYRAITGNPEATAEDTNKYNKSHYDLCSVLIQAKGQYRT